METRRSVNEKRAVYRRHIVIVFTRRLVGSHYPLAGARLHVMTHDTS